MKYLLFILIFTLSVQCTAQNQIIPLTNCDKQYDHTSGNAYIKDTTNEMDKYVGTWKWTQGTKEFILTLIKQKHHYNETGNDNYYRDRLVGYYQYKENGVIVADTSSDDLNKDFRVKVIFVLTCQSDIISISFEDYKKNKEYDIYLEKLSSTQIKFDGKERGDVLVSRSGPGNYAPIYPGNTFPLNMVLTKQ